MNTTFAERLRFLRERKNLLQKDVAKTLNITSAALSCYESGKREPNFDMLMKLCNLYGVTIQYLMYGTDHVNLNQKSILSKEEHKLLLLFQTLTNDEKKWLFQGLRLIKQTNN